MVDSLFIQQLSGNQRRKIAHKLLARRSSLPLITMKRGSDAQQFPMSTGSESPPKWPCWDNDEYYWKPHSTHPGLKNVCLSIGIQPYYRGEHMGRVVEADRG